MRGKAETKAQRTTEKNKLRQNKRDRSFRCVSILSSDVVVRPVVTLAVGQNVKNPGTK